jgi:hypothetical protein
VFTAIQFASIIHPTQSLESKTMRHMNTSTVGHVGTDEEPSLLENLSKVRQPPLAQDFSVMQNAFIPIDREQSYVPRLPPMGHL